MANYRFNTKAPSSWRSRSITKKNIAILVAAIFLVILVLEITNTTHLFHKGKAVSGTIPSTSPANQSNHTSTADQDQNSASSQNNQDSSPVSQPSKTPNNTPAASGPLITPFGNFVSNHFPGKDGSPTAEQSVCNTTPGANCYIEFTKDGVTKKLDSKVADSSGSVIWNWDVKDAGLTEGSWQITAIASANGQTKSATDQISLEIQP